MAARKLSPEGLERCRQGGRNRMAQMTSEERSDLATRMGNEILARYGQGFYRSLGLKSAQSKTAPQPA